MIDLNYLRNKEVADSPKDVLNLKFSVFFSVAKSFNHICIVSLMFVKNRKLDGGDERLLRSSHSAGLNANAFLILQAILTKRRELYDYKVN